MSVYEFPRWTDWLRPILGITVFAAPAYIIGLVWYAASPETINVGYQPEQPIPYSHAIHAGQLGMDCRYCHTTVEGSAFAAIPPTETCLNCHDSGEGKIGIHKQSPNLQPLRESAATGDPIPWVKVHDLPDYVYFNHSAHVTSGVSCVECHGRVDQMKTVRTVEPLAMGWCLDCHRDPDPHLRPADKVTDLSWDPSDVELRKMLNLTEGEARGLDHEGLRRELGSRLRVAGNINPKDDCSTCHR